MRAISSPIVPSWSSQMALFSFVFLFVLFVISASHSMSDQLQPLTSPNHCTFDCVHGRCNRQTRVCVCSAGWAGADCDLCPVGLSCPQQETPALSFILPQASPLPTATVASNRSSSSVAFVSVFGAALPKGVRSRYDCLFGSSLTKGRWVSPSLVRCPVPKQSVPGKYAFSIVSEGSTRTQIAKQSDQGTPHFTFFVPCSSAQCHGFCLGPFCLCPHAQFGNFCQLVTPMADHSTTVKMTFSNDTAMTRAIEFQPYFVKIPNWNELSRVKVQSDISGLELNSLEGILCWLSPLGRVRPYSIGVSAKTADGTNFVANWTLKVEPSYSAQLDKNESITAKFAFSKNDKNEPITANSNGRLITGRVIWKGPKAAFNRSIPLRLRVLQSENFMEEIAVPTESDGHKFRFVLFPYLGVSGKFSIAAIHPGISEEAAQSDDETAAIELAPWPQIAEFDAEVKVEAGHSFEQKYSLQMAPMGGRCSGEWHFEVIEPREMIGIENATFERDGAMVRLRFRPLPFSAATAHRSLPLALKTAFICMPTGQSQIIRQKLIGIGRTEEREGKGEGEGVGLEMDPKRLFVTIDDRDEADHRSRPSAVFTLDLSVPSSRSDLLQRSHLESASFSPFALVWLSRPTPNSWRLWLSLRSDQWEKGGNSDGALLIRGGEKLALSVPYRIQRSSSARSDAFLFTLIVKDPDFAISGPPSSAHFSPPPTADVELFSQRNGQQFAQSVLFNVPVQFGPLRSDLFQLRIRSRNFRSFASLVKIDPLDNALVVHLRRMPNQYLAFNGQTFAMAWEESDDSPLRPRVRLSPSELSDANAVQFVDITYTDGPPNSFVWLNRHPLSSPADPIDFLLPNAILCLGCGVRQRLRLRSFPSVPTHCAALSVALPFSATLSSGESVHFRQFLLITGGTTKDEKDEIFGKEGSAKGICHWEEEGEEKEDEEEEDDDVVDWREGKGGGGGGRGGEMPNIVPRLALRSPIFRSCPHAKLRLCVPLFRPPGPKCAHWWAQLPDDLLTVHTIAQFLLLSVDCRREGADLERMEELTKCIASVDRECPFHPSEAEMAPHRGGQLFNQMGHLRPFRAGLQSLFPALSLIESQLINFPALLGEFLYQLKLAFPSASLLPLSSPVILDQFVAAIADNSSQGPKIEGKEIISGGTEQLVAKWNRVTTLVSGGGDDDLGEEEGQGGTELAEWRALVASADRLKSVARQFGAENPFSLFEDVLRRIFTNAETNAKAENYRAEETIGWADVRTDQEEVEEHEQFRVLVTVRIRELSPVVVSSLGLSLRFSPSSALLKFRLGPILNFGQSSELRAGDTFRAEWTVLPVAETRLTELVQLEPLLTLSFELDGQKKAQRLRAPSISVRPRPVLRLLAFSVPSFPFASSVRSLHISAINAGYSDLISVEFRELCLEIKWADDGMPVDFRFSNVRVEGQDGQTVPEGSFLSFGSKIASGNASHMTLNISVTSQQQTSNRVALFNNFSAVVSVNGSLLPLSQFEQRFFFVLQSVRPMSLLLVSEHSSSLPLYLYSKANSRLTPVATLQLVEEKEIRSEIGGHRFLSRVFALRRLALFPSPLGPGGGPVPSRFPPSASSPNSLPIASVFASLRVNSSQTFVDGVKLLRVSELSQNKRRQINRQFVWTGEDSDEKMTTINFIDLDASAAVPQLFYELLFGRPEHFRAPFFARPVYTLRLDIPYSIARAGHQEVLARITATSPLDLPLNYSLLSPQSECPFSVVPSTGDIVVSHPLSDTSTEYCLNLVATDQKGIRTRVPVQILLGREGQSQNGGEEQRDCGVYTVETGLFEHDFEKTERQMTDETEGTSGGQTTEATTTEESVAPSPSAASSPSPVVEMGGDATLLPVTFSAAAVEVTAEVRDNQSAAPEEFSATPSVSPTFPTPFSSGISPTPARPSQIHGHQQFLTAYPHRTMFSTTKTPLPALQLAGMGTGNRGTTGTQNGTERIRIGSAADTQRGEDRTAAETGQSSAQTMAEMACRLRTTKPIWALICDMAKTVYRTTILNTQ